MSKGKNGFHIQLNPATPDPRREHGTRYVTELVPLLIKINPHFRLGEVMHETVCFTRLPITKSTNQSMKKHESAKRIK